MQATTATSAAEPALVTASRTFHSCSPDRQDLFAVCSGVFVKDALEATSRLLASSLRTVHCAAAEHDDETLFGAVFQLEAVKAVVDATALAKPTPVPDLTITIAFFVSQLADSQLQAGRVKGQGKAFYQGRIAAFEQVIDMLRGVTQ